MLKKLLVVCLLCGCSFSLFAQKDLSIGAGMEKLTTSLQQLYPYILEEKKFNDPENHVLIKKLVDDLAVNFHAVESHTDYRPLTFNISYELLDKQLAEAKKALESEQLFYARKLLYDLPTTCISCHQQDRISSGKIFTNELDGLSNIGFADYQYLTRNYKDALDSYKRIISSSYVPKEQQIAIERVLTIYLQIEKSPKKSIKFLKELNNQRVPEYLQVSIKQWMIGLHNLEKNFSQEDFRSFNDLQKHIHAYFEKTNSTPSSFIMPKEDQVFYLLLSGHLYDYLYTTKNKNEIPALLYWLSLCERALDYNYNFSLSNLYLKECIRHDPQGEYAKKCYNEYEEYITLLYSGSAGIEVPEPIVKEMQDLKELVFK